jgi:hypothetical protein
MSGKRTLRYSESSNQPPVLAMKGYAMKRITLFLVILGIICGYAYHAGVLALAQEPAESTKQFPVLMHMKLDRSKDVLEGLSVENYGMIAENARRLKLLSLESGWNVIQSKEYEQQSHDFRRACDVIADAAEEKNINRAALGYVTLTVRCVECHSYVRRRANPSGSLESNE